MRVDKNRQINQRETNTKQEPKSERERGKKRERPQERASERERPREGESSVLSERGTREDCAWLLS